jgi:hypothetical protein
VRKPLLDVTINPAFEELLHSQIGLEIVRGELRDALQSAHSGPKIIRPKKRRHHKPVTERLYARLREVPRNVPLKEAAEKYDHRMRPFPVPKHLRDGGWPESWSRVWLDADFRRKFHDLRQHAWQAKPEN